MFDNKKKPNKKFEPIKIRYYSDSAQIFQHTPSTLNTPHIIIMPSVIHEKALIRKKALELVLKQYARVQKASNRPIRIIDPMLGELNFILNELTAEEFVELYLSYKSQAGKASNTVSTDVFFENTCSDVIFKSAVVVRKLTGMLSIAHISTILTCRDKGLAILREFYRLPQPDKKSLTENEEIYQWFIDTYFNEKSKVYDYCENARLFINQISKLVHEDCSTQSQFDYSHLQETGVSNVIVIPVFVNSSMNTINLSLLQIYIRKLIENMSPIMLRQGIYIDVFEQSFFELKQLEEYTSFINRNYVYIADLIEAKNQISRDVQKKEEETQSLLQQKKEQILKRRNELKERYEHDTVIQEKRNIALANVDINDYINDPDGVNQYLSKKEAEELLVCDEFIDALEEEFF